MPKTTDPTKNTTETATEQDPGYDIIQKSGGRKAEESKESAEAAGQATEATRSCD